MILWRISNHSTLDGAGGLIASARWHTEGRRVVYFAETPAGALLEALVSLELNPIPRFYRLLKAEAPDQTPTRTIDRTGLAKGWLADAVITRTMGDEWLASAATTLLRVPSAIVPETFNILLNPAHPDAGQVHVLWSEKYPWDARLLK